MVTTSYQYPQYLYALQHDGESVQLPNGSWETPAAAWELKAVCREETNGKGSTIQTELQKPAEQMTNCVRAIYKPFTIEEINAKIVEMLRPEGMTTPVELVYQSIDGLHTAIPNHKGDWYFTGKYPTPGGTRLCNQAFVNYIEKVYQSK